MPPPLTAKWSVILGFSFNTRLGNNLDLWRNAVLNQDIDCCGVIDGPEGSGKSLFSSQVGTFEDHKRKVDLHSQVGWSYEKILKAIRTLPKGSAIIYDESARSTDRRAFASKANMEFNRLLRECRQYNQFLILVLPTFYDMDQVAAVWRTRWLIHVWYDWDLKNKEKPLQRGFFRFYNEEGKKMLYTNKVWRQQYRYPHIPNQSFDAQFSNHWCWDHEEYKKLKREAEIEHDKPKKGTAAKVCPQCESRDVRYRVASDTTVCRKCGWQGRGPAPEQGITTIYPEGKV